MTAVIQIDEQYTQQFQQFMKTLPEKAVKLTLIKNNLDEEILRRITEIKSAKVETKPLSELSLKIPLCIEKERKWMMTQENLYLRAILFPYILIKKKRRYLF